MSTSRSFPTASTYRAVFTVTDGSGDPLPVGSNTEATFTYVIARTRGGDAIYTADPSEIEVEPDGRTGVVEVTIPADDIFWTGGVTEELRLSRVDTSVVISQRRVVFTDATTEPEP
jgi:hypothetical protein